MLTEQSPHAAYGNLLTMKSRIWQIGMTGFRIALAALIVMDPVSPARACCCSIAEQRAGHTISQLPSVGLKVRAVEHACCHGKSTSSGDESRVCKSQTIKSTGTTEDAHHGATPFCCRASGNTGYECLRAHDSCPCCKHSHLPAPRTVILQPLNRPLPTTEVLLYQPAIVAADGTLGRRWPSGRASIVPSNNRLQAQLCIWLN